MRETLNITVPEGTPPQRLDKMLAQLCPDYSRSRLKMLILEGQVCSDGAVLADPNLTVEAGMSLEVRVPPPVEAAPPPEDIPLDIVFEDEHLLVINKAVGMVVHPGAGNPSGTLVNALLHYCGDSLSGIGGVARPGIVHRLDKETSGLIVVAKNDKAHQGLSDQLSDRSLSRLYTAFVWKAPVPLKGKIDQPIGRHKTQRTKMALRGERGREAVTRYHMKEQYGAAASKIECKLLTGRTHQIRVHMGYLKTPIIGDPLYGLPLQEARALLAKESCGAQQQARILAFGRQALHAGQIGFIHPVSGENMRFKAPLPEDLKNLENDLKSIS
ncbi:MAG: RluA family pseudouridine synthase [Rhodospirillales bacterium]|nr:RluA family pseudouridine synthase [Alphaproteobacteria bacterium]USO03702.1 MAG: RluA family pseudouridine synthase [Rhodospirillales bacterium]